MVQFILQILWNENGKILKNIALIRKIYNIYMRYCFSLQHISHIKQNAQQHDFLKKVRKYIQQTCV